ncbi:hypothetical protein PY546_18095 [Providencia stuartii]|nr:hypothetical protein [Providencia stuartii]
MTNTPKQTNVLNINAEFSHHNSLRRLIHCLFAEKLIDKKQFYWDFDYCGYIYQSITSSFKILFTDVDIYPANTVLSYGNIYIIDKNNQKEIIQTIDDMLDILKEDLNIAFTPNNLNKLKK